MIHISSTRAYQETYQQPKLMTQSSLRAWASQIACEMYVCTCYNFQDLDDVPDCKDGKTREAYTEKRAKAMEYVNEHDNHPFLSRCVFVPLNTVKP
jgi:hypothetical protein